MRMKFLVFRQTKRGGGRLQMMIRGKAKKGLDEIPSGHSHDHVGVIAVSEESLFAG